MNKLTLALVTAIAVAAVTGCTSVSGSEPLPPQKSSAAPAAAAAAPIDVQAANKLLVGFTTAETGTGAAKTSLAKLTVVPAGPMKGYSRTLFPHWRDASIWGWPTAPNDRCTARNAALYRDGAGVTMSSTCTRLAGRWLDPYTAVWFTKTSDIDIDHIVPLAEAWRSGAAKWTLKQRTAYANSPLVLVSVEDNANQSKSDQDPAGWRPANKASWCLYAKRWIAVKTKFRLTVDSAEKKALSSMLSSCRA